MWVLWAVDPPTDALEDKTRARRCRDKLSVITGFVVLFSIWVGLFTNARRAEIIVASAAYAAILVVYVGNV
jgi:hypothetical protein